MSRSLRFAILATAVVGLVAWGSSILAAGHFRWGPPELPKAQGEALRPEVARGEKAKPLPVEDYRDRVDAAIIREPQDTWSNLAFVLAGALIFARDRRTPARFLGVALVALGLASGLYHASLLPAWRTVDVAIMGWVVFALGFFGSSTVWRDARIFPRRTATQIFVSIAGFILAIAVAAGRNEVRIGGIKPFAVTYITGAGVAAIFGLMMIVLVSGLRRSNLQSLLLPRVALLGTITLVAILCQLGDHPGQPLFRPDGFIQAHAAWHVLMALAAYLAYNTFARVSQPRPELSPT